MHKSFDTYIPTKILFGRGRINDLGREVAALGKKALMITVPWDDVQGRSSFAGYSGFWRTAA